MEIIIAWNKETDLVVSPERFPENNEWARFTSGSLVIKKQYVETAPEEL